MERKTITILTIVIIIIASTVFFYESNPEKSEYSFYYSLEMYNEGPSAINITVIVPIPEFQKDEEYWLNTFLNESNVHGVTNYSITDTPYGKGLWISFNGACSFNVTLDDNVPAGPLTMLHNINDQRDGAMYYYFAEFDNTTSLLAIDLDYHNNKRIGNELISGYYSSAFVYTANNGYFIWEAFYSEKQ